MRKSALATCAILLAGTASPAHAALDLFKSFVGTYGLSTDGGGSLDSSYIISAFVPVGATVTGAYLYQATYQGAAGISGITLNGNALVFDPTSVNASATYLASARADVTALVSAIINGGLGGTYNFTIGEANSFATDGTALAVIYSLPSLSESTVALLDGFSALTGDTTSINFASPLNPAAPGFVADMRIASSFSCCSQASTITVNGTIITTNAGNNDDGSVVSDGSLITVGGNDDPFSPFQPSYDDDHERYDLTPQIMAGDTSIRIDTINPSFNDNIFLAAFRVSGRGGINEPPPPPNGAVPEPSTWAMLILGFGAVGASLRRRQQTMRLSFA